MSAPNTAAPECESSRTGTRSLFSLGHALLSLGPVLFHWDHPIFDYATPYNLLWPGASIFTDVHPPFFGTRPHTLYHPVFDCDASCHLLAPGVSSFYRDTPSLLLGPYYLTMTTLSLYDMSWPTLGSNLYCTVTYPLSLRPPWLRTSRPASYWDPSLFYRDPPSLTMNTLY